MGGSPPPHNGSCSSTSINTMNGKISLMQLSALITYALGNYLPPTHLTYLSEQGAGI